MVDRPQCETLRDSLVELALGIAYGEDRARVLAHVAGCADCRRLLDELAQLSDQLLCLAPVHEPPAGFEVRVLDGIGASRRPARRRGRLMLAFAAGLAVAALSVSGALFATREERRLGNQLSAVLDRAHGSYFAVSDLRDARRRKVGLVFHYGGDPSWVFVTLDRPLPAGRYRAALLTRGGGESVLGPFVLRAGERSFGSAVTLDLRQATGLRLRARDATYVAEF